MSILAKLYAIRSVNMNAEKGNVARYGRDEKAAATDKKRQQIDAPPIIRQAKTRMYGLIS
jgi:hypothetical protein